MESHVIVILAIQMVSLNHESKERWVIPCSHVRRRHSSVFARRLGRYNEVVQLYVRHLTLRLVRLPSENDLDSTRTLVPRKVLFCSNEMPQKIKRSIHFGWI